MWRGVSGGLQVHWRRQSRVGGVPRLVTNRNVVLVRMQAGLRAGMRADMRRLGWRNGNFAQRLSSGGVSLARPPLEGAGSPQSASMSGLILRLSTESESRSESREVAAVGLARGWLS